MSVKIEEIKDFISYLESDAEFCRLDSTDIAVPYSYSEELTSFMMSFRKDESVTNYETLTPDYVLKNLDSLSVLELEASIAKLNEVEKTYSGTISSQLNSGFIMAVLKEISSRA